LEADVDLDPNDAPRYLGGVEHPASKEDPISAAEESGTPKELVQRSGTLGFPGFSVPGEVGAELRASPSSGTYGFQVPAAR
jgi:hypothetical protein